MTLSNRSLGPSAEIIVSEGVAAEMLRATARAARPWARALWELELVRWLEVRARDVASLDVGELAWTPEHFAAQRRFVVDAIARAAWSSPHAAALVRWRHLVDAHPREAVHVGRRWQWHEARLST